MSLIWVVKLLLCELAYGQYGQRNGFSPVCIRIWILAPAADGLMDGQNGQPYLSEPSLIGSVDPIFSISICNK